MSKRDKLVENFILKWIPFKRKEIQKELDSIIDSILTEAKAKSTVEPEVMPNEVVGGGNYLFGLKKRYIELKQLPIKYPHSRANEDEFYLIGEILKIYGVQKDKLPLTVEKFIKYESQREA